MNKKPKILKKYSFTLKDPIIEKMRGPVAAAGGVAKVAKMGGASTSTMYNWFSGETRRPQFCTVAATLAACGIPLAMQMNGQWKTVSGKAKKVSVAKPTRFGKPKADGTGIVTTSLH